MCYICTKQTELSRHATVFVRKGKEKIDKKQYKIVDTWKSER